MISERDEDAPKLNRFSSFDEVSQFLVKKHLHKDFLNNPNKNHSAYKKIKRYYHGGLHASTCVVLSELLIELIKTHSNNANQILGDITNDAEMRELFSYAVFCHDIANTSESDNNSESHAKIFTEEMLALGYDAKKVAFMAGIMRDKDNKNNKHPLKMLLHDVDSLDFNRTLNTLSQFDMSQLEILSILKNEVSVPTSDTAQSSGKTNITQLFTDLVKYHFNLTKTLNRNLSIHEHIELADNCFQKLKQYMQAFRLWAELQPDTYFEVNCFVLW